MNTLYKTYRIWFKIVATLVVCLFFVNSLQISIAEAVTQNTESLNVDTFSFPKNLGKIKDKYNAQSNKLIIHIQDAHCNYAAQYKISDIISYFNEKYDIKSINLEGGKGKYDLSIFTDIQDEKIRKKVTEYFVKEGIVSGSELFAANNPEKVKLWGIENTKLYLDNLNVYKEMLKNKKSIDTYLKEINHILLNLKRHIFSKKLLAVDIKYSQYKSGNLDFKDYISFLMYTAKKNNFDIKQLSNINAMNEALIAEKNVNFKKANRERNRIVDKLNNKLSKRSKEELILKTVKFKKGAISQYDFYVFLLDRARMVSVDISKFKQLQRYIDYISLYNSINKSKIMKEIGMLEEEIKERLYENDKQKDLMQLSKNFALLKNIFEISLTKEDYRYYKANKTSFNTANYIKFIEKEAPLYRINSELNKNINELDSYREEMFKFYEYSFKRDKTFLKNLKFPKKRSTIHGLRITILITGGFHSENLHELFRKQKISYISILPKFRNNKGYESPYFSLLSGGGAKIVNSLIPYVSSLALYSDFCQNADEIYGSDLVKARELWIKLVTALFETKENIQVGNRVYSFIEFKDAVPIEGVVIEGKQVYAENVWGLPIKSKKGKETGATALNLEGVRLGATFVNTSLLQVVRTDRIVNAIKDIPILNDAPFFVPPRRFSKAEILSEDEILGLPYIRSEKRTIILRDDGMPVIYIDTDNQYANLTAHGSSSEDRKLCIFPDRRSIPISYYLMLLKNKGIKEVTIISCNPRGEGGITIPAGMTVRFSITTVYQNLLSDGTMVSRGRFGTSTAEENSDLEVPGLSYPIYDYFWGNIFTATKNLKTIMKQAQAWLRHWLAGDMNGAIEELEAEIERKIKASKGRITKDIQRLLNRLNLYRILQWLSENAPWTKAKVKSVPPREVDVNRELVTEPEEDTPSGDLIGKLYDNPRQEGAPVSDIITNVKDNLVYLSGVNGEKLYDKFGKRVQELQRGEKITQEEKDGFIKKIESNLKNNLINFLARDYRVAKAILRHLKTIDVYMLLDNEHGIMGLPDSYGNIMINRKLLSAIGLFHEAGEEFLVKNPKFIPRGLNSHTYLRGAGKKERLQNTKSFRRGVQDRVFKEKKNEQFSEEIVEAMDPIKSLTTLAVKGDGRYKKYGKWWRVYKTKVRKNMPEQGWKLHVAATSGNVKDVLSLVLPILHHYDVHHKVINGIECLESINNSEGENKTQIGKCIAIYTKSKEQAEKLAEEMDIQLRGRGFKAPENMQWDKEGSKGDKLVKGSKSGLIGYRYGAFTSSEIMLPDGEIHEDVRDRYKHPLVVETMNTMNVGELDKFSKGEVWGGEENREIIAVGDIHGNLDGLREILYKAKLVQKGSSWWDDVWIGEDRILLNPGDIMDTRRSDGRGGREEDARRYLKRLKGQARKVGGDVIRLLGNHDMAHIEGRIIGPMDVRNMSFWREAGKEDFKKGIVRAAVVINGRLWIHGLLTQEMEYIIRNEIFESKDISFDEITKQMLADRINEIVGEALRSYDFSHKIFDTEDGIFWFRFTKVSDPAILQTQGVGHQIIDSVRIEGGHKILGVDLGMAAGGDLGWAEIKPDGRIFKNKIEDEGVRREELIQDKKAESRIGVPGLDKIKRMANAGMLEEGLVLAKSLLNAIIEKIDKDGPTKEIDTEYELIIRSLPREIVMELRDDIERIDGMMLPLNGKDNQYNNIYPGMSFEERVGLEKVADSDIEILEYVRDEEVIQNNLNILNSKKVKNIIKEESFGGNAGRGYIGLNVAVDLKGSIVAVGNTQTASTEVQNDIRKGLYEHVTFSVVTGDPFYGTIDLEKSLGLRWLDRIAKGNIEETVKKYNDEQKKEIIEEKATRKPVKLSLGGNREGEERMITFDGDVWIKAGKFYYKVWIEGEEVKIQRYDTKEGQAVGNIRSFDVNEEYFVGRTRGGNDYFLIGDDLLSEKHLSLKVYKREGINILEIIDHKSLYGTVVEYLPTFGDVQVMVEEASKEEEMEPEETDEIEAQIDRIMDLHWGYLYSEELKEKVKRILEIFAVVLMEKYPNILSDILYEMDRDFVSYYKRESLDNKKKPEEEIINTYIYIVVSINVGKMIAEDLKVRDIIGIRKYFNRVYENFNGEPFNNQEISPKNILVGKDALDKADSEDMVVFRAFKHYVDSKEGWRTCLIAMYKGHKIALYRSASHKLWRRVEIIDRDQIAKPVAEDALDLNEKLNRTLDKMLGQEGNFAFGRIRTEHIEDILLEFIKEGVQKTIVDGKWNDQVNLQRYGGFNKFVQKQETYREEEEWFAENFEKLRGNIKQREQKVPEEAAIEAPQEEKLTKQEPIIVPVGGKEYIGGEEIIDFTGDVWIKAGQFYYKVWIDGEKVQMQRYDKKEGEAVGKVYSFDFDREYKVGRAKGVNNYRLSSDGDLSRKHFSLKVFNIDGRLSLEIKDLKSRNGTIVEYLPVGGVVYAEAMKLRGPPVESTKDGEVVDFSAYSGQEALDKVKAFSDNLIKNGKAEEVYIDDFGSYVVIDKELLSIRGFESIVKSAIERVIREFDGKVSDFPPITISVLDESTHMFEDHIGNGFIGINRRVIKDVDEDVREILLAVGLRHELAHEITKKSGKEFEKELLKEDVEYVTEFIFDWEYIEGVNVMNPLKDFIALHFEDNLFYGLIEKIYLNKIMDYEAKKEVAFKEEDFSEYEKALGVKIDAGSKTDDEVKRRVIKLEKPLVVFRYGGGVSSLEGSINGGSRVSEDKRGIYSNAGVKTNFSKQKETTKLKQSIEALDNYLRRNSFEAVLMASLSGAVRDEEKDPFISTSTSLRMVLDRFLARKGVGHQGLYVIEIPAGEMIVDVLDVGVLEAVILIPHRVPPSWIKKVFVLDADKRSEYKFLEKDGVLDYWPESEREQREKIEELNIDLDINYVFSKGERERSFVLVNSPIAKYGRYALRAGLTINKTLERAPALYSYIQSLGKYKILLNGEEVSEKDADSIILKPKDSLDIEKIEDIEILEVDKKVDSLKSRQASTLEVIAREEQVKGTVAEYLPDSGVVYAEYMKLRGPPVESTKDGEVVDFSAYSGQEALDKVKEFSDNLIKNGKAEKVGIDLFGHQYYLEIVMDKELLPFEGQAIAKGALEIAFEEFEGNVEDLPPLTIVVLDESSHMFEDHIDNGFIGINRKALEREDGDVQKILLETGLIHEFAHEILGKRGDKFEEEQIVRDAEFIAKKILLYSRYNIGRVVEVAQTFKRELGEIFEFYKMIELVEQLVLDGLLDMVDQGENNLTAEIVDELERVDLEEPQVETAQERKSNREIATLDLEVLISEIEDTEEALKTNELLEKLLEVLCVPGIKLDSGQFNRLFQLLRERASLTSQVLLIKAVSLADESLLSTIDFSQIKSLLSPVKAIDQKVITIIKEQPERSKQKNIEYLRRKIDMLKEKGVDEYFVENHMRELKEFEKEDYNPGVLSDVEEYIFEKGYQKNFRELEWALSQIPNVDLFYSILSFLRDKDTSDPIKKMIIDYSYKFIQQHGDLVTTDVFDKLVNISDGIDWSSELVIDKIIEPLFFKNPSLFDGISINSLNVKYGKYDTFKYLLYYVNMNKKEALPIEIKNKFQFQSYFKENILEGEKKVLLVQNRKDGLGDELMRITPLAQALLDNNPELKIVLYTRRPWLYDHPRVETRAFDGLDAYLRSTNDNYDMIINYYQKGMDTHEDFLSRLSRYCERLDDPVFLNAPWQGYEGIKGQIEGRDINSEMKPVMGSMKGSGRYSNHYQNAYRVLAEFGLSFETGTNKRHEEHLLTGVKDVRAKKYWDDFVGKQNSEGRPVVIFNGFGGAVEEKGLMLTKRETDREAFKKAIEDLVSRGYFVIIATNGGEWATPDIAESVISEIDDDYQKYIFTAPTPGEKPYLYKHLVDKSDFVVTVEGGLMHLAYFIGKPFLLLPVRESGEWSEFFPIGADLQQVALHSNIYARYDSRRFNPSETFFMRQGKLDEMFEMISQHRIPNIDKIGAKVDRIMSRISKIEAEKEGFKKTSKKLIG